MKALPGELERKTAANEATTLMRLIKDSKTNKINVNKDQSILQEEV